MLLIRNRATPSDAARRRILSCRGEPLFLADWMRVLMMHFEVDADALQCDVPFQLDLRGDRAFVGVVAFTMERMRPRVGGRLAAWLFKPLATHEFLNVRTYVRHGEETGIHFLTECLPNRVAVRLGPRLFSLPYRFGRIRYRHVWLRGEFRGGVEDASGGSAFAYRAEPVRGASFVPCESGSLNEWLMERYTAFNCVSGQKKYFRVWHPPWQQRSVEAEIQVDSLLRSRWRWFNDARLLGANYSPGLRNVWMGLPHRVD